MKSRGQDRNAQRRAAYQYYRSCGYSPALAANARGRTKATWKHYFETGKREGRKAPALKTSKPEKASIRKELRTVYGLSPKIAGNWSRLKEETLQFRINNLRGYITAICDVTGKSEAEARRMLSKHLRSAKNQAEFWDAWREFYDGTVGFPG